MARKKLDNKEQFGDQVQLYDMRKEVAPIGCDVVEYLPRSECQTVCPNCNARLIVRNAISIFTKEIGNNDERTEQSDEGYAPPGVFERVEGQGAEGRGQRERAHSDGVRGNREIESDKGDRGGDATTPGSPPLPPGLGTGHRAHGVDGIENGSENSEQAENNQNQIDDSGERPQGEPCPGNIPPCDVDPPPGGEPGQLWKQYSVGKMDDLLANIKDDDEIAAMIEDIENMISKYRP